jgi:hypothetical protein
VRVRGTTSTRQNLRIESDKPVTVTARSTRADGTQEPARKLTVEGAAFLRNGVNFPGVLSLTSMPGARTGSTPRTGARTEAVPATTGSWRAYPFSQPGGVAVDVGLTGGGTFRSTGGSFIRGVDNFLNTNLTDRRSVDVGGDSGFVGGMVNIWQVSPGQRWFLQTGVNVPVSSSSSANQTGLNTGALGGANGDATFNVEYDWMVPIFAGISGPISTPNMRNPFQVFQDPRWRIGGGGIISHGSVSISGVDGAARTPFSASESFTDFDPGFLVGLRGGIGGGWIAGADLTVTWRGDKDVTAPSNTPGFVQSYTGHLEGGVDANLQFSLSYTLGGRGMAPAGGQTFLSDARVKRDVVALARLDSGLGLYRYRYTFSDQLYVGVMAQEVEAVRPDAIVHGRDGYLRVDYGRLGLRLQTWEQWQATH